MDSRPDEEPPHHDGRPIADAFSSLRVERVERADGSYALYFSWPSVASADLPTIDPEGADV